MASSLLYPLRLFHWEPCKENNKFAKAVFKAFLDCHHKVFHRKEPNEKEPYINESLRNPKDCLRNPRNA